MKPFNPGPVKEQVRETLIQSARRHGNRFLEIQQRIGLNPAATVDVLRGLGQQLATDVSTIRNQLAAGRKHGAMMTLQGLKSSCTTVKDSVLVTRIDAVAVNLETGDLTSTLEGLEGLQSEGKRIWQMADKFALLVALENSPKPGASGSVGSS